MGRRILKHIRGLLTLMGCSYRKVAENNNFRVSVSLRCGKRERQRRCQIGFHIGGLNRLNRCAQGFLMVGKRAVDDRLRVATNHHHLINEAEIVYEFQGTLLSRFET